MNRIRDSRGGQNNISDFSQRMKGDGVFAHLIQRRFNLCVRRLGMNQGREFSGLNDQLFRKPKTVPAAPNARHSQGICLVNLELIRAFTTQRHNRTS